MLSKVGVKRDLQVELLRGNVAMTGSVLFVDEFHGEDLLGGRGSNCFFDAGGFTVSMA